MQRRVNYAARIERLGRELKNLNFGGYSRRVNQSGACSSSDVITSGGRKSESTMEDKLIVVVCGYPELYDTTSYFYKNRNTFCNETGAAWLKPPHDANSHLLCSEFHAWMKRVKSKCSSVQLRVNSATYSLHSRLVWTHLKSLVSHLTYIPTRRDDVLDTLVYEWALLLYGLLCIFSVVYNALRWRLLFPYLYFNSLGDLGIS